MVRDYFFLAEGRLLVILLHEVALIIFFFYFNVFILLYKSNKLLESYRE